MSLAGLIPMVVNAAPPPVLQSSSAHYTQSDFVLPFQVKPGGRCPQCLDLMVSRDGGRSWQVHQTATPAEGRFYFAQAEEGEYWLKVQVRDAAGSAFSNSTMHLIVDRTLPRATIECDLRGDSTLDINCKVEDPYLDTQSIQLFVRTDADNAPRAVPLQSANASRGIVQGQSHFSLPPCKSFELRLEALDLAGNKVISGERFFHPVFADEHDALLPSTVENVAETCRPQVPLEVTATEWTAIELGVPTTSPKTQLASMPAYRSAVRKLEGLKDSPPEELIPPKRESTLELEPPLAAQPPISQVQSSTKKFQLQYKLNELVSTEQLQVELWVTTDRGNTWEFWGLDRDAQSPASIEVDREGEFGFCIVCVHTEADLRFRPVAGDKPDLYVNVKVPEVKKRLQAAARN